MSSPAVPPTPSEAVPAVEPPATRPEDSPRRYAGIVLAGIWLVATAGFLLVRMQESSLARVVKTPFRDGTATARFACGGGPHGLYLVFDETRPAADDASQPVDLAETLREAARFAAPAPDGAGVRRGSLALVEPPFVAFVRDPAATAWREAAAWAYLGRTELPRGDVVVEVALPTDSAVARDGVRRPVALWLEPLHGRSGLRAVVHDLAGFVWLTILAASLTLVYVLVLIRRRRKRGRA